MALRLDMDSRLPWQVQYTLRHLASLAEAEGSACQPRSWGASQQTSPTVPLKSEVIVPLSTSFFWKQGSLSVLFCPKVLVLCVL